MRYKNTMYVDAYMTLEAALVIPAAVFGMVLIIYMSFFVYGRCILSQDVYILGFRSSIFYEKNGYNSPVSYITDHKEEQIKGRYFGSRETTISSYLNGKTIIVEGKTQTNHNALHGYFSGIPNIWESESGARIKMRNNAKTLRRIKRTKDIYEGLMKEKGKD